MTDRRTVLQTAAGLALGQALLAAAPGRAAVKPGTSKPGEFEFLAGEWRIKNRQLKKTGEWDVFDGEATVHSILAGVGSIEELRIPARQFSGTGIRLLDRKQGLWADYWVNARDGVLSPPPTYGGFVDGAGVFISEDMDGDAAVQVRGIWDGITRTSCRWSQAMSYDGGKTWTDEWLMEWTRA